MTEQQYLNNVVSIKGRFHRSTHLVRDWKSREYLDKYVMTPTAKEAAQKLIGGVVATDEPKVWTITGPYGTGKSSFLLFVTDLLGSISPAHPFALSLRQENKLEEITFFPFLIVGHRAALKHVMLRDLRDHIVGLLPELARSINETLSNDFINDTDFLKYLETASKQVQENGHKGILLIIDEFGKFLEYAAQHPETEDLFVLQELAEMASRADGSFIFLTALHSSFDGYLPTLDETRKIEWKKIQGRFTDIPFLEPPEQFLSLIGQAISWDERYKELIDSYQKEIKEQIKAAPFFESNLRYPLEALLPFTIPLDPFVSLLLWPLFRSKLAQNERSLFAFLMDYGPFGFQEFLSISQTDPQKLSFYHLDRLYDYVTNTLGSAVLLGEQTKKWGEIEHAIERIPFDAPDIARSIVKAVGLLSMYGAAVGLSASEHALKMALGNDSTIGEGLDYLSRLSIIVHRRFTGGYALWEGSDVDLESCYKEAQSYVGHDNFAERLKKAISLRPFVARAHYIQKGILRFFDVDIIDGSEEKIRKEIENGVGASDGKIVFILSINNEARTSYVQICQQLAETNKQFVFAFPKPIAGIEHLLGEVEAWTWVRMNVQALQGDPVAKKEVDLHLVNAIKLISERAGQIFGIRGYVFDPSQSEWVHAGQVCNIPSALRFQQWLSELCDIIFASSPILHNELLNREHLSAAATAARRNLIQAMIEKEADDSLGIIGTPAEMSMYRAMLSEGGFHKFQNGSWKFKKPNPNWRPVWNAMESFLENARENRQPILELINILKKPPYGVREGPIFVLLTNLILLHKDYIALYEDGIFVSNLRVEVFERLTRLPGIFEIQIYQLSGKTREAVTALNQILDVLHITPHNDNPFLLDVAKPLVTFAIQLPEFTKKTKRIEPPEAMKVRDTLLRAGDPYKLLFIDLPTSLGMTIERHEDIAPFVEKLRNCILVLQSTYPDLLNEIETQIRNVFGLFGTSDEVRQVLQMRASPLVSWVVERTITPFIRAAASNDDERDWREVFARAIAQGKPPYTWLDYDVTKFQILLMQIASDFVRIEELVAERNGNGAVKILRVGILEESVHERRAVISVSPENSKAVDFFTEKINELLDNTAADTNESLSNRIRLAALTMVIELYLKKEETRNE